MQFLGSQNSLIPLSAMTIIIPLAGYFLILGLLNSRRRPQLLRSSEDAVLLLGTLSLLFVGPLAAQLGPRVTLAVYVAGAAGGIGWMRFSTPRCWVVYNLPNADVRRTVAQALTSLSLPFDRTEGGFVLADGLAVEVRAFPLLRNTVIRLRGQMDGFTAPFEEAFSKSLRMAEAQPHPAASACVLLATVMLVLPATLAAERAGEIVRIIADLLP